jgi:hypothetical protein
MASGGHADMTLAVITTFAAIAAFHALPIWLFLKE